MILMVCLVELKKYGEMHQFNDILAVNIFKCQGFSINATAFNNHLFTSILVVFLDKKSCLLAEPSSCLCGEKGHINIQWSCVCTCDTQPLFHDPGSIFSYTRACFSPLCLKTVVISCCCWVSSLQGFSGGKLLWDVDSRGVIFSRMIHSRLISPLSRL